MRVDWPGTTPTTTEPPLGGEICATLNGASIYIAVKRGQEKIKDELLLHQRRPSRGKAVVNGTMTPNLSR